MKKKISNTIVVILVWLCMAISVNAEGTNQFCISNQDLIISSESGDYSITGETNQYNILVEGGTHTLTLNSVTIDCTEAEKTGIELKNAANVTLVLIGDNAIKGDITFTASSSFAGIQVPEGCTLTIKGEGTLDVYSGYNGAAIGGTSRETAGTINIESGRITATAVAGNGAGIGGGYNGKGGTVNISGGYVTATGSYSAGIGGGTNQPGGNVTITGGTIVTTGGSGGAGIGGGGSGANSNGGTVVITGGNVYAKGTNGGETIGKGSMGADSGTLKDDKGNDLYLACVNLVGVSVGDEITSLDIEGSEYIVQDSYPIEYVYYGLKHSIFMYLPHDTTVTRITAGEDTYGGTITAKSTVAQYKDFALLQIPKVKAVVIQEAPEKIIRGTVAFFSYSLDYQYLNGNQVGMSWSIQSEHAPETKFYLNEDNDWRLHIDCDESADSITVRLTSDFDNSKYAEVTIDLCNPKLLGVTQPTQVENVINGTDLNDIVLPNILPITTELGQEVVAVSWDKSAVNLYDPSGHEAQSFQVDGVVELPTYLDQNGISLNLSIQVNVLAAENNPQLPQGGVSGVITNSSENPLGAATVKLTKGGTNGQLKAQTVTDKNGRFTFVNIPYGVYSLVAEKESQIVTKTIVLNNQKITANLQMPDSKINTVLEVKEGAPIIATDNLEYVFSVMENDVEIKLVIEEKEEATAEGKDQIVEKLMSSESVAFYLDAKLLKTDALTGDVEEIQPQENSTVNITIELPEALWGKQSYSIVRYHGEQAEKIACQYDELLHILTFETDRFSTYAVVYKEEDTSNHNGSSKKIEYTITASMTQGGTITPSGETKVVRGKDVSYTITPDSNYVLDQLIVDGSVVDCVTEYKFERVIKNHSIEAVFIKVEKNPFEDIDEDDWYYDAVNCVYENGLMNGMSDTEFLPQLTTTRAMFVTLLWRLEEKPEAEDCSFIDLAEGEYYVEAVKWAAKNGIVKGYSEEIFAPEKTINREEMATILYRYANFKNVDINEFASLEQFVDRNDVSAWAEDAFKWAVGAKIISGRTENQIVPHGNAKRCELAEMIMRYLSITNASNI